MSSYRAYLMGAIHKEPGFQPDRREEFFQGRVPVLDKVRGLYYITVLDSLSEPLNRFVIEYVWEDRFIVQSGTREIGVYYLESATAEVDALVKKGTYSVRVFGPDFDYVEDLLERIKTGTIRPEKSYDGGQTGKSRAELEAELLERSGDKARADAAEAQLNQYKTVLLGLVNRLRGQLLPWVDSRPIVRELTCLLMPGDYTKDKNS